MFAVLRTKLRLLPRKMQERYFDFTYERFFKGQSVNEVLDGHWPGFTRSPKIQVRLRHQLLRRLHEEGDKINALSVAGQCLELLRSHHFPQGTLSECLSSVASVYEWCEDWEAALPIREELWVIEQGHHGAESPRAIVAMEYAGVDCRRLGDLERASGLLTAALEYWRSTEGPTGERTIHTEIQLGITRHMAGDNERAEALLVHGTEHLPDENPLAQAAYSRLASALSDLGDHGPAIRSREKALTLQIAKAGTEDRLSLLERQNLAVTHWNSGDRVTAELLLDEVLVSRERLAGSDESDTAHVRELLEQLRAEPTQED